MDEFMDNQWITKHTNVYASLAIDRNRKPGFRQKAGLLLYRIAIYN